MKSPRLRSTCRQSVTVIKTLEGDGLAFETAMRIVTWVFDDAGDLIAVDDPNLEDTITVSNSEFQRAAYK